MAKKPTPAAPTAPAATSEVGGKVYKRVAVTLSTVKLVEGVPTIVRADSVIHKGKVLKGRVDKDGNVMKPADVLDVTVINADGSDGSPGVIICGKAIKETLDDTYPNGGYKGRIFEFTAMAKKDLQGGHTFRPVSIVELSE